MAYQTLMTLDADVTISLGGKNNKTNKANPEQIEGFYLGARAIPDRKKKTGVSYIHVFLTSKGNVAVWGKTNMDNQLKSAVIGQKTRVTYSGMRPTPNGDMYVYTVEQDPDSVVDVDSIKAQNDSSTSPPSESDTESLDSDYSYTQELVETYDDSSDEAQEVALAAAAAQAKERAAKVQALLAKKK